MQVMHVVPSLDCGGSERILLNLLREAPRLGQRATVLCLEQPGSLAAEAAGIGAQVLCAFKPPGFRFDVIRHLASLMRQYRPDIVHTHEIGTLFYAGRAARGVGVPRIVHTEHGKTFRGSFRKRVLGRLAAVNASRFFCVSGDVADEVIACRIAPPKRVRVVTNGIDPEKCRGSADACLLRHELGIPDAAPVIGTVGRLTEIKRQDLLLRGFHQLRRGDRDPHLLLVGDGPLLTELQALARNLGIEARVHFAGYQAQPERYLHLMDVFALTSRSEGMPLAVLESWAAGVPVVVSNVGGLPEMVDDGRTGLLFPSGEVSALALALQRLIDDPSLSKRMGEAGRGEVDAKYDVRRTAEEYHRQYLECQQ
jgi:glycosyltransferase involved in cell wall biosynthesis